MRNDRENTAMCQETKEVIQNLQEELTDRQDSYSELLVKHKKEVEVSFSLFIVDIVALYFRFLIPFYAK